MIVNSTKAAEGPLPVTNISVGQPAPDVELDDFNGQATHLSSFWTDRPLVLMLLRHFG